MRLAHSYRVSIESGDHSAIVAAYRNLQPLFQDRAAYPALSVEMVRWTGKPLLARPQADIVIQGPTLLPWTVALCHQPPWPDNLPTHAIPVSVLELTYLQQAPPEAREALHREIIKQWERTHIAWDVQKVLGWFKESEWEVCEIRDSKSGAKSFSAPAPKSPPSRRSSKPSSRAKGSSS